MPPEYPFIPPTPFYRLVRTIVSGLVWCLGGITIRGAGNIPAAGPVILASNHRANVDPPYLSLVTARQMHFMAKEELFRVPVFGRIFRGVEAFPVKRGTADRAALRRAVDLLKQGRVVMIFPEGTRSQDTSLQEAEKGFALIARQSNAVIVPIALEGTEKMLPKGSSRLRRAPVTVTVGRPLTVAEIMAAKPAGEKDALAWIGAETMREIGELMQASPTRTGLGGGRKKEFDEYPKTP